jgi:hypothetical protein
VPYSNREKRLEYMRKWNKRNYSINKESEIRRIKKRQRELVKWLQEYKRNFSCEYCGETEPICLDFHHIVKSSKDAHVGDVSQKGWGKARILNEIEKCIVLCSNCHRKLHAGIIKV